jgi:hypothetical protein
MPDLAMPQDLNGADFNVAPSLCSSSTAKICDPFEGGSLNARWTLNAPQGTATLDTSRAYRGSSSLHLHTNAAAGGETEANLITHDQLPVTGTLWARVWVYIPSGTPTAQVDQFFNFADESSTGVAYCIRNGHLVSNDYTDGLWGETLTGYPLDQWFCLKMQLTQGSTGAYFYIGDTQSTDLSHPTASPKPESHLYLGIDWLSTTAGFPATDLWLDELVVDDKTVTCTQ